MKRVEGAPPQEQGSPCARDDEHDELAYDGGEAFPGEAFPGEDATQCQPEVHEDQPLADRGDAETGPGEDVLGEPLKDVYEVEKVLDVRETPDGKREFLIKWRGWGPNWNNWEPEEHILDRRLLRRFNQKRKPAAKPPPEPDDDVPLQSKRRCAKQATRKARMAALEELPGAD